MNLELRICISKESLSREKVTLRQNNKSGAFSISINNEGENNYFSHYVYDY